MTVSWLFPSLDAHTPHAYLLTQAQQQQQQQQQQRMLEEKDIMLEEKDNELLQQNKVIQEQPHGAFQSVEIIV